MYAILYTCQQGMYVSDMYVGKDDPMITVRVPKNQLKGRKFTGRCPHCEYVDVLPSEQCKQCHSPLPIVNASRALSVGRLSVQHEDADYVYYGTTVYTSTTFNDYRFEFDDEVRQLAYMADSFTFVNLNCV